MRLLQRLRRAIRELNYRVSSHANLEMSEDNLVVEDIENAVLTGRIVRRFTRDPRGIRCELVGSTTDGRRAGVVCRFLPSGPLLIITAYVQED